MIIIYYIYGKGVDFVTLKQLDYFYHLCSNPHISRVAEEMNISQPAVSLAIKALEEELEEQLFSRIGKKLVLNERGRFFREQTYRHFLALKDAGTMFRMDRITGDLTVATSKTFSSYLIPGILFNFHLQFPKVSIRKKSANSAHIVQGVKSGTYDVGFVESNVDDPGLAKEKIGEDELIVVSGDSSLSLGRYYIDTLLAKQWILRESGSGTRDIFLDKLSEMGLKPEIFMELPEFEEIKNILLENSGTVSCISRLAVKKELERGELFQIKLKNLTFSRDLFLVYYKKRYKTLLFRKFVAFVTERFHF